MGAVGLESDGVDPVIVDRAHHHRQHLVHLDPVVPVRRRRQRKQRRVVALHIDKETQRDGAQLRGARGHARGLAGRGRARGAGGGGVRVHGGGAEVVPPDLRSRGGPAEALRGGVVLEAGLEDQVARERVVLEEDAVEDVCVRATHRERDLKPLKRRHRRQPPQLRRRLSREGVRAGRRSDGEGRDTAGGRLHPHEEVNHAPGAALRHHHQHLQVLARAHVVHAHVDSEHACCDVETVDVGAVRLDPEQLWLLRRPVVVEDGPR
mmetsp:Transcript_23679/g.56634  ORF Transcript_23679/g.56634 Transcript_23679/m.56634 type:complete len:264 (+) Transcript_23679:717-1508(+)